MRTTRTPAARVTPATPGAPNEPAVAGDPAGDPTPPARTSADDFAGRIERRILARNEIFKHFFDHEAERLAVACHDMAKRFLRGGRLLAFGRGPYATDAQHVSVEFVHPVIVGKRALPALDLSLLFRPWLDAIAGPDDIAMGFGPPSGDRRVEAALHAVRERGTMTFALPGGAGSESYAIAPATDEPFMHQEMIEILYHTLWETVHVFLEHQEPKGGHPLGATEFLYPFLAGGAGGAAGAGGAGSAPDAAHLIKDVAASIRAKVADDARLREQVAAEEVQAIVGTAMAIHERVKRGGRLLIFGNGGSATDANDLAIDCVAPPAGWRPIPALSLAMEPAILSALANDVGPEVIFLRQLIAHGRPGDVAVAISTSGGSRNVIAALDEARKRQMLTVALLGYDGGEIKRLGLAEHVVVVRSDYIPRIQEVQATIYHTMRTTLEMLAHDDA